MDFLASQMGISKKTIYDSFKDKDDLILHCVRLRIHEHQCKFREIVEQSSNVIAAVYEISVRSQDIYQRTNPLFYLDLKKYYPEIYAKLMNKDELRNDSVIYTMIEKGIREGVFDENINIGIVNIFWQELIAFIHDQDKLSTGTYQQQELFENILNPFIRGLCTVKGMNLLDRYVVKKSKERVS
jgi:AcrR family transcriptional regulator